MKKQNVAAEPPMYWPRVASAPRGPGPPLHVSIWTGQRLGRNQERRRSTYRRMANEPWVLVWDKNKANRSTYKDEANGQSDASSHHGAHLHCMLVEAWEAEMRAASSAIPPSPSLPLTLVEDGAAGGRAGRRRHAG